MKKRVILSILATIAVYNLAHAETVVKSTLRDATVYTQGAMLHHTASIALEKGAQVIQISGVSSTIDASSILVSLPPNSHLMSVSSRVVSSEKKNMNYDEKKLVDSFQHLSEKAVDLQNTIETEQFSINLIKKNDQIFTSKEGNTADVLKAYTEYKKLLDISHTNIQKAKKKLEEVNNNLNIMKSEIQNRGIWTNNKTVLELALQNEQTGTQQVDISYYTSSCRWVPTYRISNKDAQPTINLDYKASILQNTGFDWKDVNLSISTGNPQRSNLQPTITAWFLKYVTPSYTSYSYMDNNGRFGKSQTMEISDMEQNNKVAPALPVNTNNLVATTVFQIKSKYDVKSGLPALAHLKSYSIPADIYFYAVPKLDKEVYLLASFTLDQSSELLPGEALIMSSGDYVGKTQLDPYKLSDTLKLSLGRAPSVQVKREVISLSSKKSTIGNKTTSSRFFNFEAYNGLDRKIRLVIKDNVPISTDNSMDVNIKELSRGQMDDDSKIVTWDLDLAPRAKKNFEFGYEVKYLKDKNLEGL